MKDNIVLLHPQAPVPSADETATIVLLREQGLSLNEIARRTKVPKSTVSLRLKMAKEAPMHETEPLRAAAPVPAVQPEIVQNHDWTEVNPESSKHSIRLKKTIRPLEAVQTSIVQRLDWTKENPTPSKCSIGQEKSTHRAPTAQPKIVQNHDWTDVNRPTTSPSHSVGRPIWDSVTSSQRVGHPMFTWGELARMALLLAPVVALTPWLVATSAEVYAREVGDRWGWWLALGFECFFLALAALAPQLRFRASTPGEFWASIPRVAKTLGWYAVLGGMAAYSFHATTLTVTETRTSALTHVAAASTKSEEVADLRQERERLTETLSRYEAQGWLGEARKIREDLRALDTRLESARERAVATTPATMAAIEHRASVGKYLRLLVLLINIFCVHLVARSWQRQASRHHTTTKCFT